MQKQIEEYKRNKYNIIISYFFITVDYYTMVLVENPVDDALLWLGGGG